MFEDLARHPGFTYFIIGGFLVAAVWMYYVYKRDQEQTELQYAVMDLLWKIWGEK